MYTKKVYSECCRSYVHAIYKIPCLRNDKSVDDDEHFLWNRFQVVIRIQKMKKKTILFILSTLKTADTEVALIYVSYVGIRCNY